MTTLLFLKLTVTPVLVAVMSLIARRFGPAMGGVILGLPWMTGPILFFLAMERGLPYLEETSRGVLLAVPAIGVYTVCYAYVARFAGWLPSLAAGSAGFLIAGYLLSFVPLPAPPLAALAIGALLLTRFIVKPPRGPIGPLTLPWWDIPARMLATGSLVGCLAIAADYVGPTRLGIISTYPVIMTVLTTFSHHRWGIDVATTLLRAVMLSLIGFACFFLVLALYGTKLGLVPSFALATAINTAFSVGVLIYNQKRRPPLKA